MAGSTPWRPTINLIVNGEDVKATVANRAPQALSDRTQYLYDVLQDILAGQALFLRDVALEAATVVGNVVYYDDEDGVYKRALAAVELDETNGWYKMAKSAFPVGLVYAKSDTELGTIVTVGALQDFDLSAVIEQGVATQAGPYYLSMLEPGKLVYQKPAVSVYVLYNRGDDTIHLLPTPRDVLESHVHFHFDLYAQPAGDANCAEYGEDHYVINPDSDLPGWLPADDESFNGLAPEGAKFGYNLAQHPELLRVWPPMPLESAYITVNSRGIDLYSETCPIAIVDCHGIWWMQDCYGTAPWAPAYPCNSSSSLLSSEQSSSSSECPCVTPIEYTPGMDPLYLESKSISLWFARMTVMNDQAFVTSLSPCSDNSPILLLDCDGEPATTGRLCASLDLSKLEVQSSETGYTVVKGFGQDTVITGPAVTGIQPGAGIAVSVIGGNGAVSSGGIYRGDLLVGLEDRLNDPREGQPSIIAFNNVREYHDPTLDLLYYHFPQGRASSIRGRIEIDTINMSVDPIHMQLWCWFVGLSAGALPTLDATYRRIPVPVGLPALPAADTDIVVGGWDPALTFVGGDYGYAETPFFNIVVGDTVFFTLGWDGVTGPTEGFGIIRIGYYTELV